MAQENKETTKEATEQYLRIPVVFDGWDVREKAHAILPSERVLKVIQQAQAQQLAVVVIGQEMRSGNKVYKGIGGRDEDILSLMDSVSNWLIANSRIPVPSFIVLNQFIENLSLNNAASAGAVRNNEDTRRYLDNLIKSNGEGGAHIVEVRGDSNYLESWKDSGVSIFDPAASPEPNDSKTKGVKTKDYSEPYIRIPLVYDGWNVTEYAHAILSPEQAMNVVRKARAERIGLILIGKDMNNGANIYSESWETLESVLSLFDLTSNTMKSQFIVPLPSFIVLNHVKEYFAYMHRLDGSAANKEAIVSRFLEYLIKDNGEGGVHIVEVSGDKNYLETWKDKDISIFDTG